MLVVLPMTPQLVLAPTLTDRDFEQAESFTTDEFLSSPLYVKRAVTILGVFAFPFLVAVGLSLVPGFKRSAGITVLAAFVAWIGVQLLVMGVQHSDRHETRTGLSIFSGFILAGTILGADAIIKAIG